MKIELDIAGDGRTGTMTVDGRSAPFTFRPDISKIDASQLPEDTPGREIIQNFANPIYALCTIAFNGVGSDIPMWEKASEEVLEMIYEEL